MIIVANSIFKKQLKNCSQRRRLSLQQLLGITDYIHGRASLSYQ